jgi:predicted RNA-binding Zn ribbon-like protein
LSADTGGPRIHLLGEPISLELANTVSAPEGSGQADLLAAADDAADWLEAAGFSRPERPDLALAELRSLREAVRGTAELLLADRRPSAEFLHTLNEVAGRRPTTPIIRYRRGGLEVVENLSGTALEDALGQIARDAARLFGGPDAGRIKPCEGPGCPRLFLAAQPRRRWCSPRLCGNRVRVARHYRRSRAGGAGAVR